MQTATPWLTERHGYDPTCAYPIICIASICANRQARLEASHLFDLAFCPVTRQSAYQLGHALPEVLAGLWVGRLSTVFQAARAIALSFAIMGSAGFYVGQRATARNE